MSARAEFAEDKARHGAAVALTLFNKRVLRWARCFTSLGLSRVMYTMGTAMDGETHSRQISVNGSLGSGSKGQRSQTAPRSLMARYAAGNKGKTISYRHFWRYLKLGTDYGVLLPYGARGTRQDESGPFPGGFVATTWSVDFSRVVVDGQVVPHDFTAPFPEPAGDCDVDGPCVTSAHLLPRNDTGNDTGSDTPGDTGNDTQSKGLRGSKKSKATKNTGYPDGQGQGQTLAPQQPAAACPPSGGPGPESVTIPGTAALASKPRRKISVDQAALLADQAARSEQERWARIQAQYDADSFPFIRLDSGGYKLRGRGKPRPGQIIEYFTAQLATERGLELPSLDTAA